MAIESIVNQVMRGEEAVYTTTANPAKVGILMYYLLKLSPSLKVNKTTRVDGSLIYTDVRMIRAKDQIELPRMKESILQALKFHEAPDPKPEPAKA
jgi:hypothetical protein